MMSPNGFSGLEKEYIRKHHHHHDLAENQCSSFLVKHIRAPVHLVRPFLSLLHFIFSRIHCFNFQLSVFLEIDYLMKYLEAKAINSLYLR